MNTSISSRRETLNSIVLLAVVFAAVQISNRIPDFEKSHFLVVLALVTSKGAYELLVKGLFWLINSSDWTLRIYWGSLYIKGIWSYEYTLAGKRYFGVWDIRQDVEGTSIVGNGLDDAYQVRTLVRSVSPLIEETGGYFVINRRDELNQGGAQVFSKTTLLLDRSSWFSGGVKSMRAITVIYGGPSDKQLHPNVVFRRHGDVSSIEALIEKLKKTPPGP